MVIVHDIAKGEAITSSCDRVEGCKRASKRQQSFSEAIEAIFKARAIEGRNHLNNWDAVAAVQESSSPNEQLCCTRPSPLPHHSRNPAQQPLLTRAYCIYHEKIPGGDPRDQLSTVVEI